MELHDLVKDYILNKMSSNDEFTLIFDAANDEYIDAHDVDYFDEVELDEVLSDKSPSEIVRLVYFGDVTSLEGFAFNGYGNLISRTSDDVLNICENNYLDELADYAIENELDWVEELKDELE